jgi:negative regulator of flagellin synthesis FlgM
MKVSEKSSGVGATTNVSGSRPVSNVKPASAPTPAAPGDDLTVSSGAQFMAVTQARIAAIPDIRTEKVEAIKAQMDAENYNPDGEAVADGLVKEHTPPPAVDQMG